MVLDSRSTVRQRIYEAEAQNSEAHSNFLSVLQDLRRYLVEQHAQMFSKSIMDREVRPRVIRLIEEYISSRGVRVAGMSFDEMKENLAREIVGLGPIDHLLLDPEISEIMVNGYQEVYYEKNGITYKSDVTFRDAEHLMGIVRRILDPVGKQITPAEPLVDAKLGDMRLNVTAPPVSLNGVVITIRKYMPQLFDEKEMVSRGVVSEEMLNFLRILVEGHANIVLSGGTGSGKTTTLKVLARYIPPEQRVITIEDTEEMRLKALFPEKHVLAYEARVTDSEKTSVTLDHLLRNALRQAPKRIIVGEVRGPEVWTMLQAMNTGHPGSWTTVHANSPAETVNRLLVMSMQTGIKMEAEQVGQIIASTVDVIIHQQRYRGGARRVAAITEVLGYQDGAPIVQDIFRFDVTGVREGAVVGEHKYVHPISNALANRLMSYGVLEENLAPFLREVG